MRWGFTTCKLLVNSPSPTILEHSGPLFAVMEEAVRTRKIAQCSPNARETRILPAGIGRFLWQSLTCRSRSRMPRLLTHVLNHFFEMMLQTTCTRRIGGVFFNAFLIGIVTLLVCQNITRADEVPAFFLKIAKIPTLPRVGRSGRFEDFFYKAEKHIPRIGRSNPQSINPTSQDEQETYSDLTKRRIEYPKVEEWTWQNFPLAIEGPRELWRALAGYSRDANDDIENEVWQRKKRTGSAPTQTK
ncbi:uncharacterized protein LOC105194688 [Solenopsis invicta]|uniref:uncharacterized protein LOC105194688 n=1 Tax=Solenopsis invicta TaxID=13686 RepID=UPI00193DB098|nr:uncharacterized protein LOC105194688 [Solenopsis invicta]